MGKQEREKRNDFSWEDKQWKQPTKVKGEGNIFIPIFPQKNRMTIYIAGILK